MDDDPLAEFCCPMDWFVPAKFESSDSDVPAWQVVPSVNQDLDGESCSGTDTDSDLPGLVSELPPCGEWSTARLPNNHQPTEEEVSHTQWFQDGVAREEAEAREAEAKPLKHSPWLSAADICGSTKVLERASAVMATLPCRTRVLEAKPESIHDLVGKPLPEFDQYNGFDEDLEFDSDNEVALVHSNVAPDFKVPGTYLEQWDQIHEHVKHAKRRRLHGKQSGEFEDDHDGDDEAFIPAAPASRSSARAAHRLGLSAKEYRKLRRVEAPCILYQVLFFITSLLPSVRDPDITWLDMYMGRGHIKDEAERRGFQALGFEVLDDAVLQNAMTLQGMITMLLYCMRLGSTGVSHWGTVCSSWVFLSRSSTGRTKSNIRGYNSCLAARTGNTQVGRMVLALLLLQVRGACWILEQPNSSIMYLHHAMQWLWRRYPWVTVGTNMGAFGGPTPKPTKLRSNKAWVGRMRKTASAEDKARFKESKDTPNLMTARQLTPHADGRKRVSGAAQGLKDSQIYPIGYAQHLVTSYVEEQCSGNAVSAPAVIVSDSSSESDYPEVPDMTQEDNACPWRDLDIGGLEVMMNQRPNRMPF